MTARIVPVQHPPHAPDAFADLWEDHEEFIVMATPQPFSLSETIAYLTRSSNECLFHVDNGTIYRLIPAGNDNVLVAIRGSDAALEIRFPGHHRPAKSTRAAVAHYIRAWFDLDTDLVPFYDQMEHCPIMRPLSQAHYGLRVIGVPDLFEALCWAIIGQQINLSFAYTLKRRLVESFGQHQPWNGQTFWLFPTPDTMVHLAVEDLLALQFSRKKAEYVLEVARRMSDGTLSKSGLQALQDFKAAERDLVNIRGIGPWTANYVLMRCLRDPSAFPIGDVGLQNAVKQTLGMDRKPTLGELQEMAVRWAGWEAYATFYLWMSL